MNCGRTRKQTASRGFGQENVMVFSDNKFQNMETRIQDSGKGGEVLKIWHCRKGEGNHVRQKEK